jgi:hypothetical protein
MRFLCNKKSKDDPSLEGTKARTQDVKPRSKAKKERGKTQMTEKKSQHAGRKIEISTNAKGILRNDTSEEEESDVAIPKSVLLQWMKTGQLQLHHPRSRPNKSENPSSESRSVRNESEKVALGDTRDDNNGADANETYQAQLNAEVAESAAAELREDVSKEGKLVQPEFSAIVPPESIVVPRGRIDNLINELQSMMIIEDRQNEGSGDRRGATETKAQTSNTIGARKESETINSTLLSSGSSESDNSVVIARSNSFQRIALQTTFFLANAEVLTDLPIIVEACF